MAEQNRQNLDEENFGNQDDRAAGAAAGAGVTESQRMKAQTGGEQTDQLSGETPEGAHNQDRENRNPSGQHPDRGNRGNRGAGHEGGGF